MRVGKSREGQEEGGKISVEGGEKGGREGGWKRMSRTGEKKEGEISI